MAPFGRIALLVILVGLQTASAGDPEQFHAIMMLTRQPEAFLEQWKRPPSPDYRPEIKTASEAVRGETIAAMVLFGGCRTNETGNCNATTAFRVVGPDGEPYAIIPEAKLWSSNPIPAGNIQLGVANLAILVEPEDLLGEYVVHADVCDKVADRCLELERRFTVRTAAESVDLERFLEGYYDDPRPLLVESAIRAYAESRLLEEEDAAPPAVGFFAVVLHDNPDRRKPWLAVIQEQVGAAREVLGRARELSGDPTQIITAVEPSPARNDMLWGAFFGGGDAVFLRALVEQLDDLDERADLNLFLAAASAKWSLASNAEQHKRVREILEELAAEEQLRPGVDDVLATDPLEVREWMVDILRTQRENGVW